MKKKCDKCGRRLDRRTGRCPACNRHGRPGGDIYGAKNSAAEALKILKNQKGVRRHRYKRAGKKIASLISILLVIIILVSVAFGFLAYFDKAELKSYDKVFKTMGISRKQDSNKGEFNSNAGSFTDIIIKDDESAIKAAQDAAKMIGLTNAADDLTVEKVSVVNGLTYYRIQQNYMGIPVYGRTINIVADESGVSKGFSSNAEDITVATTTVDLKTIDFRPPTEDYLINVEKVNNLKEFSILTPDVSDLIIYKYQGVENAVLACKITVTYECETGSGYLNLIFDVENEKVIEKYEPVSAESAVCYGPNAESGSFNGLYTENGTYVMKDTDRNIYVFNAGRDVFYDMYYGYTHPDTVSIVESSDEYFGNEDDEGLDYDKAYDVLSFLGNCYDFYDTNFNCQSYGKFLVVYNDELNLDGDNAAGGKCTLTNVRISSPYFDGSEDEEIGFMDIGYRYSDDIYSNVDILAHEYSHVVSRYIVDWKNSEIPGAINEGISDIFGEILQSKITGNDPDWALCDRTIYDPSENGYPENINSRENGGEDYSHGHSTCISYAAYLMTQGVDGNHTALTLDEVAQLYYNALWLMPSDGDYSALGQALTVAADVIGFSEEKQECVSAALNAVGITDTGTNTFGNEITLSVYGINGALYNDYTVTVTGEVYTGALKTGIMKKDYEQSISVNDSSAVKLNLERGDYTLTISDNSDDGITFIKEFKVRSASANNEMRIDTNYGSDYSIATDTMLQVYDVNNLAYDNFSISITGITDDNKTYTNEISVNNTNPVSLGLSPGSYTFRVTDLGEGGKSLVFTARVIDSGACETLNIRTEFGSVQGKPDPQRIPYGAGTNNGHYYFVYSTDGYSNYKEIEEYCESLGGYPVTITSSTENNFVRALVENSGYSHSAIGLRNKNGWVWSNGEKLGFTNWKTTDESGDCAAVSKTDGKWSGSTVDRMDSFVCEWGEYSVSDVPVIQSPYDREPSAGNDTVIILDVSDDINKNDFLKLSDSVSGFAADLIDNGSSVAVVTYDSTARTISELSKDTSQLEKLISGINSGGVNYDACLQKAERILSKSNADTKDVILITDNAADGGTETKNIANYVSKLEDSGINVYTLGVFENLKGREKSSAVSKLDRISGENRHYESQSFSDAYSYLSNICGQIINDNYICLTLTGSADITVESDEFILSSSESDRRLISDIGTISLIKTGDSSGDKIVVRLLDDRQYDITMIGNKTGTIQYKVAFTDGNGKFVDTRTFDISIIKGTVINTDPKQRYSITLDVDYNGNGNTDARYKATADSQAEKVSFVLIYVGLASLIILVVVILFIILFGDRISKKRRLNSHLGSYR